jgi:hypothetical protein
MRPDRPRPRTETRLPSGADTAVTPTARLRALWAYRCRESSRIFRARMYAGSGGGGGIRPTVPHGAARVFKPSAFGPRGVERSAAGEEQTSCWPCLRWWLRLVPLDSRESISVLWPLVVGKRSPGSPEMRASESSAVAAPRLPRRTNLSSGLEPGRPHERRCCFRESGRTGREPLRRSFGHKAVVWGEEVVHRSRPGAAAVGAWLVAARR